ncbi:hypothetical protein ACJJIG_16100 [Microbulbifer sp. SSSA007]|uniref:hypothetical protein n=1 Tax=unclassified Microbulbifer TaxID=2619833 RepID=UPI00403941A5
MTPIEFLTPMSQRERASFAEKIGTTLGYLNLVRGGHRRLGPSLAKRFVSASGGQVSRPEARPDLWQ